MPSRQNILQGLGTVGLNNTTTENLLNIGEGRFRYETPTTNPNDFPGGFVIREMRSPYQDNRNDTISLVRLIGNSMPMVPFAFGGGQRVHKTYYPGNEEPSMQIMGGKEDDVKLNGQFKAIRLPTGEESVPEVLMNNIERIRLNGNLCRFTLGAWARFGFISMAKFEIIRKTRVNYEITINILGVNPPQNGKLLEDPRRAPLENNQALLDSASALMEAGSAELLEPPPQSIFDTINGYISDIADNITTVTDFVDSVFSIPGNIRQSVDRVSQIIESTFAQMREFKKALGGYASFEDSRGIITKYDISNYYSNMLARTNDLTRLLQEYRTRILALSTNTPQARHLGVQGDTWQKLSVRYLGSAEEWPVIPEFNSLPITSIVPIGEIIEIPRRG